VNAASLPYTVLLLLAELAIGSLAVTLLFDARRMVTRGYVKLGAIVVFSCAALAVAAAEAIGAPRIEGYRLDSDWMPLVRVSLRVFAALGAAYLVAVFMERYRLGLWLGAVDVVAGVAVLIAFAGLVGPPTWSYVGALTSLLAGSLVLGGTTMAMSWGHWYLTNSGLPKEPLEQMSLLVLGAIIVQAALVVVGAVAPVREVPLTTGLEVGLGENPAFWLRVGIGLVFPAFLAWLAWRAASIRGMMSATGLLYIAMGAVMTGELLGRGLLFTTGSTV
jgi:hypothetical protein